MLGDLTPREAAAKAKTHPILVQWLKSIENGAARQAGQNEPMATYDFARLWRELGVESLRK